ncbi:MAG TPA: hypothetical protein PLF91_00390 [Mycolicibacterium fallax]|nr:hypothetical protein [Mycolicibacterium fallax]
MIAAGFAVNAAVPGAAELPAGAPAELRDTVDRVRGWFGDPGRYRHFLGAAMVLPAGDTEVLRSAAVLAGWRAGVLRLRAEALARAAALPAAVTEAALGLPAGGAAGFLAGQARDPFHFPGAAPFIGLAGGFRGLGGPWLQPPDRVHTTGAATVAARTGTQWWQLTADVFGVLIRPVEDPQPAAPGLLTADLGTSYHVWLSRCPR